MVRRAGAAGMLVLAAAVIAGFGSAGTGQPTVASVVKALDKVERAYSSQLLGMCVGAVDGTVSVAKCYGRKAPGSSARATVDTLFAIDSVSKTFTAALLSLRAQQKSVALGDSVSKYVPALGGQASYPSTLTLQELANHYSGLPKGSPEAGSVNNFLLLAGACLKTSSCRLSLPGGAYHYSNWAFAVLGDVLGLHDGFADGGLGPWAPDNAQAITHPLGMTATKTWGEWQRVGAYFAAHRATSSDRGSFSHFPDAPYGDPGGGLFSSARDMLKWLRYSMGIRGTSALLAAHHLLYEDTATLPTNSAHETIGLAWQVNTSTGTACVWKGGDGLGFHSYVLFVKAQRRGIFLLVNNDPTPDKKTIGKAFLNGLPRTPGAGSPTC